MKDKNVKKPDDMADDTIMSGDGVNPIAKDTERPDAKNARKDGFDIFFPGFPGGPSIG